MSKDASLPFSPYAVQRLKRVQTLLDLLQPHTEPIAYCTLGSLPPRDAIIIFPGSFNPPTHAHLALLKQAQQFARLHEPMHIYAAFSKHTVDKESVERPLLLDRVLLLDVMLRRRFRHSGILLFNRGLYVEEAQAIQTSFPRVRRMLFLLGFDKVIQIFDPHYYADRDASLAALFNVAELLVAPRGDAGEDELFALLHQPENERFARYVHALPLNAVYRTISSTRIRQGIVGAAHEVPQEVRQFMRETRAYAPTLQLKDGTEIDFYGERVKHIYEATQG